MKLLIEFQPYAFYEVTTEQLETLTEVLDTVCLYREDSSADYRNPSYIEVPELRAIREVKLFPKNIGSALEAALQRVSELEAKLQEMYDKPNQFLSE